MIKYHVLSLDSQTIGKAVGRAEDVPKRAVAEVLASTSQVTSGSVLPREKVELAVKQLDVSSRILRVLFVVDRVVYCSFCFCRKHWDGRLASPKMRQS